MYKRIIIKLSGEALSGDTDNIFSDKTIDNIAYQIKQITKDKTQVCIVIGGGNLWRGRSNSDDMDRTKSDQIGMLSTIINATYLSSRFSKHGLSGIVMTPFTVGNMTEHFSKEKALNHLEKGNVLIFAGGIGHPFFSTDTITALRACELEVDAILFAKSIDGVYDKDPSKFKDAKKYDKISCINIIENNLKVIDITAANLCYENKIPIIIFGLLEDNSIIRANNKEKIGTIVTI